MTVGITKGKQALWSSHIQAPGLFFTACFVQGNEAWLEMLAPLVERLHLPEPLSAVDVSSRLGIHKLFPQLIADCSVWLPPRPQPLLSYRMPATQQIGWYLQLHI